MNFVIHVNSLELKLNCIKSTKNTLFTLLRSRSRSTYQTERWLPMKTITTSFMTFFVTIGTQTGSLNVKAQMNCQITYNIFCVSVCWLPESGRMISCSLCNKWYCNVCVNTLKEAWKKINSEWFCDSCS